MTHPRHSPPGGVRVTPAPERGATARVHAAGRLTTSSRSRHPDGFRTVAAQHLRPLSPRGERGVWAGAARSSCAIRAAHDRRPHPSNPHSSFAMTARCPHTRTCSDAAVARSRPHARAWLTSGVPPVHPGSLTPFATTGSAPHTSASGQPSVERRSRGGQALRRTHARGPHAITSAPRSGSLARVRNRAAVTRRTDSPPRSPCAEADFRGRGNRTGDRDRGHRA